MFWISDRMQTSISSDNEAQELSRLIGDIYDAALDHDLWSFVLKRTCAFVGGACSGLVVQDPVIRSGQFYHSWGVDPGYERLYLERYIGLNQAAMLMMTFAAIGEVHSTDTVMVYEEYLASRFHREWAAPQQLCDFVGAVLDKASTNFASISVIRHERDGRADDEARRRMSLIVPHFQRAVAIGKVIDLHKVEAAALADALDGMASAMFLVDGQGHVVHANAAGDALMVEGSVLHLLNSKITATDSMAHRALYDSFRQAEAGDAILATSASVPLAVRDGTRHVAHVLPLTSGARRAAGITYAAVAAVFVRKAALELPHTLEAIATAFRLTPAEMRVLMTIVDLGGIPDVALVLGVSETTVKTHLHSIFGKTNTHRQADLVKLVAGYVSPLAS
jgi:DNA-binding CsgD family transcriptional regulator